MLSHRSLSDSKSLQVSRTLLSILADLNNAVVRTVFTCPFISKSSSSCINLLVTVSRTPSIIGITVTFMFHSLFNSQAKSCYLSFFSFSFNFTLWSVGTVKCTIRQVLFFLFFFFFLVAVDITRSGRLAEIRWCVFISKSRRSLCISFTRTDTRLRIYVCAYSYDQISISCTIPSESPYPTSRV